MAIKLYRMILPVVDIEIAVNFYSKVLGIDGEPTANGLRPVRA